MRILVCEDDFVSRSLMLKLLAPWGQCEVALDGKEAVEAVEASLQQGEPYGLICLDIVMPRLSGQDALLRIRCLEDEYKLPVEQRARLAMVTVHDDAQNMKRAFRGDCDGYLVKPVTRENLARALEGMGLKVQEDRQA